MMMIINGMIIDYMNPCCVACLIDLAHFDRNKGGRTEVALSQWNSHHLIWNIRNILIGLFSDFDCWSMKPYLQEKVNRIIIHSLIWLRILVKVKIASYFVFSEDPFERDCGNPWTTSNLYVVQERNPRYEEISKNNTKKEWHMFSIDQFRY